MSATDVKEIVYHCECRRFVEGPVGNSSICPECGKTHMPDDEYGG